MSRLNESDRESIEIRSRARAPALEDALVRSGVHPILARLYAARGVRSSSDVSAELAALVPPAAMLNCDHAARLLADAIERGRRLLIIADYDCDGATACAVGMRALRAFGANVDYFVPNRFELGYGLTPEVVQLVAPTQPDLLITVDNGIASVDGVLAARAAGIATLITDHHLPGDRLPAAECIVNPNQPGCDFPSKSIAGVGVMFYVLLALRAELRRRGAFRSAPEPNLAALLDLVALGTVADVVRLDHNNRILVAHGLRKIRDGRMQAGMSALFAVAGRDPRRASTLDLAFGVAPRLNAASRLADMHAGIDCLVTDDPGRALEIARTLDDLNRERRTIEASMLDAATARLPEFDPTERASLSLFEPDWHQGVIGILAGRLKDQIHRPTFAFARANAGELRGSGRSIPGFHLRDALDLVSKLEPDLLVRFGGHAAAAGVTLRERDFERFIATFERVAQRLTDRAMLERRVETDGSLEPGYVSVPVARMLEAEIWGQGFPPPLFDDAFDVASQRLVAEKHLRLRLMRGGREVDAILFNRIAPLPPRIQAAYRLVTNEYNGLTGVQLSIEHWRALG